MISTLEGIEIVVSAIKKYPPDEQDKILSCFQEIHSVIDRYGGNTKEGVLDVFTAIVAAAKMKQQ
jgi:hypothetical protein